MKAYRAYGLRWRSEFALPFEDAERGEEPDVVVASGPVPASLDNGAMSYGLWQARPGKFLLSEGETGRFLVEAGTRITVEPAAGADTAMIRTFLVASCSAALLYQRRTVPLHASGIATGAGAVLFAGASGTGKSSLQAEFSARGVAALSDDVVPVVRRDGLFHAVPSYPSAKLWSETIGKLGQDASLHERVNETIEKYIVPVSRFHATPLPIVAIFVLSGITGDDALPTALSAGDAMRELATVIYRRRFAHALGQDRAVFEVLTALARQAPVFRLDRAAGFDLGSLADRVDAVLAGDLACTA